MTGFYLLNSQGNHWHSPKQLLRQRYLQHNADNSRHGGNQSYPPKITKEKGHVGRLSVVSCLVDFYSPHYMDL